MFYNILMAILRLHTAPSVWRLPNYPPMTEAYGRVVAVELASGIIACRYATPDATNAGTYEVTDELATNLATFYDTRIANQDPEDPGLGIRPSLYTCHLFALALRGKRHPSTLAAYRDISDMADRFRPYEGDVPAGAHGIMVNRHTGSMPHSVISLGNGDFIQAIETNSHVGVMSRQGVMTNYDPAAQCELRFDPAVVAR